jgi:hypothetical protein
MLFAADLPRVAKLVESAGVKASAAKRGLARDIHIRCVYDCAMTMIRKQLFIDREASGRLKRAAAEKGVSEAELIRLGIDRIVTETEAETADWRAAFRQALERIPAGAFDELRERVDTNRTRRAGLRRERARGPRQ